MCNLEIIFPGHIAPDQLFGNSGACCLGKILKLKWSKSERETERDI